VNRCAAAATTSCMPVSQEGALSEDWSLPLTVTRPSGGPDDGMFWNPLIQQVILRQ
jgi:hypothetical protein